MFTGLCRTSAASRASRAAPTARACGSRPARRRHRPRRLDRRQRRLPDRDRGRRLRLRHRGDEPDAGGDRDRRARAGAPGQPGARDARRRAPRRPHRPGPRRRLGAVLEVTEDGFARRVRVEIPPELLRYVVDKGSVALDGVSLTVAELGDTWVEVSLIPETLERTNLGDAAPGDPLNVEVDVLAKYVERLLAPLAGKDEREPDDRDPDRHDERPTSAQARARSRRSRRRSKRSAAARWSSSATAKTARTRATW